VSSTPPRTSVSSRRSAEAMPGCNLNVPYKRLADHNACVKRGLLRHAGQPCLKCGQNPRPSYSSWCKGCKTPYQKERYHARPDRWRRVALRRKFSITLGEYDRLLKQQDGKCAICSYVPQVGFGDGRKAGRRRLAVDHDHHTGLIRGLLCHMCNRGLPFFRESSDVLVHAAGYIKRAF